MIKLEPPQTQLSEDQQWALQNAARTAWMRNNFAASIRGMDPTQPGSMIGSGGGLLGSSASLHRAGTPSAPATGLGAQAGAAIGKYALGPAGMALSAYQASQTGRGLNDMSKMASALPERHQEHAFNQLGKSTLDQAAAGAFTQGAQGAAAGSFLGPPGAAVGGSVGALTAYLAAMRRGMQTSQGRRATFAAMTPKGGQNWGRFAAHSPDASRAAIARDWVGSAREGVGSLAHKKLAEKLF